VEQLLSELQHAGNQPPHHPRPVHNKKCCCGLSCPRLLNRLLVQPASSQSLLTEAFCPPKQAGKEGRRDEKMERRIKQRKRPSRVNRYRAELSSQDKTLQKES